MNFIITNKSQLKNVLTLFYSKYKENERYNLSFDVIKKEVSKRQRGFIFGGLCKVLRAFFYETQGELYEISDIKEMLYRKAGVYEEKILPDGSSFYKYKGLSQMNMREASEFIDKVLLWIDNETECILPPYLRYCWLLHTTQQDIDTAMNFPIPLKSPDYLKYQRKEACCLHCGRVGHNEAHHIRGIKLDGLASKPSDIYTISLCHNCHTGDERLQDMRPAQLQKVINTYGFSLDLFCRLTYLRWLDHKV